MPFFVLYITRAEQKVKRHNLWEPGERDGSLIFSGTLAGFDEIGYDIFTKHDP
jgi:hypothetical protein